jgi:hypothetical protein
MAGSFRLQNQTGVMQFQVEPDVPIGLEAIRKRCLVEGGAPSPPLDPSGVDGAALSTPSVAWCSDSF